jgi:ABC-2 type transport system permease protein
MRLFQEIGYLFVRGLKQSLRPTAALIPSLFMPAFFLIISSAAYSALKDLPGFGGQSYLVFYAPVAILQALFFSSGDAGIDLVVDITSGYFDKLLIAPIHHVAIIIGKMLGTAVRTMVQVSIVIVLILLMGGKIVTGFPGFLVIVLFAAFFGMAWSGIGMTIALRTKNQRTTQSSFILFFPFTYITTSMLPLDLLHGWFHTAVLLNPVTYILEAIRALTTTGWDWAVLGKGFGMAAIVACVTITSALMSFRKAVQ